MTDVSAGLCRVCGGVAPPRMRARDLNRRLGQCIFTYHLCNACGTWQLLAPPSDLSRYYPADYYRLPDTLDQLASVAEDERYKLDIVRNFINAGKLLEIGPAVGGFAYLAKQAGFQVTTIEMDARCCAFLREVVGVGAIQSADAKSVLGRSEPVDVVALWHVLEHLPDPVETLRAAANALTGGGLLVVSTPNPQALQFALFRSLWVHLDAPRHLQLIPLGTLRQLLAEWGLKSVLETATDTGGIGWNAYGWQLSLRNTAIERHLGVPSAFPGRALHRLARAVERSGLRGATYTAAFRKTATA